MGHESFDRLTNLQLTKHIRSVAKDTHSIFITKHARVRMKQRGINISLVYECLRCGSVSKPPEPSLKQGSLECRMEWYAAGKNCCVVAAVCDEDPDIVCVTVFFSS